MKNKKDIEGYILILFIGLSICIVFSTLFLYASLKQDKSSDDISDILSLNNETHYIFNNNCIVLNATKTLGETKESIVWVECKKWKHY